MKKALLLLSFSMVYFSANAQYTNAEISNDSLIINYPKSFKKKDFLLTVGIGYLGSNSNSRLILYCKAEFALHKFIGLGFNYGYESLIYPSGAIVGINTFLLRGNIHPLITKKFDPYVGAGIGFHLISYPSLSNKQNSLVGGFDCTIGARYFILKNLALYTEFGFTKSFLQSGITYKL